jgi:hypothetical protein
MRPPKGHRKALAPNGDRPIARRPASSGYALSCLCGWDGGHVATKRAAAALYIEHLKGVRPVCPGCGRDCTPSEIERSKRSRSSRLCLTCTREKLGDWKAANRDRYDALKWKAHLWKKYRLTIEAYAALVEAQGNRCAICDAPGGEGRARLHVDHDHETGRVRALLCYACNVAIGLLNDNPVRARAAADYLERFQGEHMYALSLTQPWAGLVISGVKSVENRKAAPPAKLIGQRFAIHATREFSQTTLDEIHRLAPDLVQPDLFAPPPAWRQYASPLSSIIGTAVLVGFVRGPLETYKIADDQKRWYQGGIAYLLAEQRPLTEAIPHRGFQGFWPITSDVETKIFQLGGLA